MRCHSDVGGSHSVLPKNRAPETGAQRVGGSNGRLSVEDGLPLMFRQRDEGADDGVRSVEIHDDHVVLRRQVAGITMRLNIRMSAFAGVAVRLTEEHGEGVALVLAHPDRSLELTLYCAPDTTDIVAEWRGFARLLGLPMLVTHIDGSTGPAYPMLGRLVTGAPVPRRRRRSALKQRRPSIFRRRAAGRPFASAPAVPDREAVAGE